MKLCKMLRKKDVGATGIGAMIVFIATVLVAGIAASVLIQTSMKLETAAMTSGQQTVEEVSGGIAVFDITGARGTNLRYLAITVRTRAGSPNIDLNHSIIMMSDGTNKVILTYIGYADALHYNATVDGVTGNLFSTDNWATLTNEEFGIIVLEDADQSCQRMTPVINSGDKVVLTVHCGPTGGTGCFQTEVPTRVDVFGRVIPEIGSAGIIAFTTPAAYNDAVFDLQ
ncbi:MAG: flagellin [Euryarchaeota archaeon]|nr:flagellin [Euryarchaeota archaeon]